jgi:hypothetical protein
MCLILTRIARLPTKNVNDSHLPKVGSVGRKRSFLYKKMCGKVLRQRQLWENVTCLFMDALCLGSSMHYPVPCWLALTFTIFRFFLVKAHSCVSRWWAWLSNMSRSGWKKVCCLWQLWELYVPQNQSQSLIFAYPRPFFSFQYVFSCLSTRTHLPAP